MRKFIQQQNLFNFKRNLLLIFLFPALLFSQTSIEMEKVNGVYMIPCVVNGLSLKFVLDTGASDVSISQTEALFMLKNGYLDKDDIGENEYYTMANGGIVEGVVINLKKIEIGGITLKNVRASIVLEQKAPLLLGQSVLEKLGTYKIVGNNLILEDYNPINDKSSILDEKNGFKSLKLGTLLTDLPSFFQTAEFKINKRNNTIICIVKDAPRDLKTVFDIEMDFLLTTFDLESKILTGIQLVKVYRTVVENDDPSFPVLSDYKYINDMYSKALSIKPKFFPQEYLDSKDIEGAYAYWKGNEVLLTVGYIVTEIKLTEDNNPEFIFNLKITYTQIKNEDESIDSLFDKF